MIAQEIQKIRGLQGLDLGVAVTSIGEIVEYGFFFWDYEARRGSLAYVEGEDNATVKVLVMGGIAGVVTWASLYHLDVIKTRMQSPGCLNLTEVQTPLETQHIVNGKDSSSSRWHWSIFVASAFAVLEHTL